MSYSEIEALTITSPYSAAFSIPMRPSQLSLSTAGDAAAISLKQTLIPGLGLPVWAAFLLLYPILAVILYGATYSPSGSAGGRPAGRVEQMRLSVGSIPRAGALSTGPCPLGRAEIG